MGGPEGILDHIVINARTGLDEAELLFRALGFALTPRGHHTLGSINHLAMFASDYLELIGVPEGQAARRPEVAQAPPGLNGLVFRSRDIDATHAHLAACGAAGAPPKEFSRPVALADGSTPDARFRTVAVGEGAFPAGRLYFCQHLTPELLWRPEWLIHPNGVTGFAELVVVAPDPAALARRVGEIVGTEAAGAEVALPGGCSLSVLDPASYRTRFGALARDMGGRTAMLGALAFHGAPGRMAPFLDAAGVPTAQREEVGDAVRVGIDPLDLLLEFRPG